MTSRATLMTIDEFKAHLDRVQERLVTEKQSITDCAQIPENMPREAYAFAYLRAERMALRSVTRRMEALSWLPLHINPRLDLQDSRRESMKRWIKAEVPGPPDGCTFGNDMIHALTRCGVAHGWDSAETAHTSMRIASVFQDMACLVALIQYCIWLNDKGLAGIALTDPDNLSLSLCDIVSFIHTPALYNYLRSRDEECERLRHFRAMREKQDKNSRRSFLRLVETRRVSVEQDSA